MTPEGDSQVEDLDLELEVEEQEKTPSDPAQQEIMKWKRRAQAAERANRARDIADLKTDFPELADEDLAGQDLGKVRSLLSKLKAPPTQSEPSEHETFSRAAQLDRESGSGPTEALDGKELHKLYMDRKISQAEFLKRFKNLKT